MSCYELQGVKSDKLELTKLIIGTDFVCIDRDGFRNDDKETFFLSAKTAHDEIKRLKLESKVKIKRFPFDVDDVPNRKEYIGEDISFEQLEEDANA